MGNTKTKKPAFAQRQLVRAWNGLGSDRWRVVDIMLAASAALFGLADMVYDFGTTGPTFTWSAAALILLASAALAVRRSQPIAVLVFVSIARLLVAANAGTEVALSIPGAVALYAVARTATRRDAVIAAVVSALVGFGAIAIASPNDLFDEGITEIVLVLLVIAITEVVRTNNARTNERVNAETSERVQAERLRIARDLHDVVAHSLSNIAVQSGIASRLIDTNPEHAKKALDIINEAGRSSLDELRSLLGLLRSENDLLETEPTPGRPGDINAVIRRSEETGLKIEVTRDGDFPSGTPPLVVLAACRIIQESLTNVTRHAGPVAVQLELRHTDDDLHLRICNDPGAPDRPLVPSTGVGIIGMTERATALGGELTTRPLPSGGFVVEATLPHDPGNF